MDRRRFLILSSQAGLAAGISQMIPFNVWANASRNGRFKNLITVHFIDGWDVTLGLDPKTKNSSVSDLACFLGYRADEIIQTKGLRLGPSAAALKPYAENCIVINGVSMMGNISHEDCRRMAQTGIIDRRTPQLVSMKAYTEGARALSSGGDKLENGQLELDSVAIDDVSNMITSGESDNIQFLEADSFLARDQQTMNTYGQTLRKITEEAPELKSKFDPNNNRSVTNYGVLDEKSCYATALALKAGYISGAHFSIRPDNGTLDSHGDHKARHMPAQSSCFDQVLLLVQALKAVPSTAGASMFDETLIMVTSDFSRETALNGNSVETSGKEHNGYTNSYLLMGGGLKGDRTIGESIIQIGAMGRPSLHTARNFDFTCGNVIRTRADAPDFMSSNYFKKQIQPAHVIRTLAEAFGARDVLDPAMKELPTLPLSI